MSTDAENTAAGPIVFDLETAPLLDARAYLDPPPVPPRFVSTAADAAAAAAAHAKVTAFEHAFTKASLDWNLARIVALGWWMEGVTRVEVMPDAAAERHVLEAFWANARGRTFIGFKVLDFDLPMLLQRSLYLEVQCPRAADARRRVVDLYDYFTFNDLRRDTRLMPCTLRNICRRLAIDIHVADEAPGPEVPALVAAGRWDRVAAHCAADVERTRRLARRLLGLELEP